MIHKRLKVLILSAALLGMPAVQAFVEWKPVGDSVDEFGYALTAAAYADGDRIGDFTRADAGGSTKHRAWNRAAKRAAVRSAKPKMSGIKFRSGKIVRTAETQLQAAQDVVDALQESLNAKEALQDAIDTLKKLIVDAPLDDTGDEAAREAVVAAVEEAVAADAAITFEDAIQVAQDYVDANYGEQAPASEQNNASFTTTANPTEADKNTLNIYGTLNGEPLADDASNFCSLKIDGDVVLSAKEAPMTVNVKSDVLFEPFFDQTTEAGFGFAHIIFDAAVNQTITVNVDHDMEFLGIGTQDVAAASTKKRHPKHVRSRKSRLANEAGDATAVTDMFLTFKGQGQTSFVMANGTTIKFSGDLDTTGAVDVIKNPDIAATVAATADTDNPADPADASQITALGNLAGGTKIFITMEQTAEQAITNNKSKLVFKRKDAGKDLAANIPPLVANATATQKAAYDVEATALAPQRTMVVLGYNSIITYISHDDTGVAHVADVAKGGFGSVSFDPAGPLTNVADTTVDLAKARMVLFLRGAKDFGWSDGVGVLDDKGELTPYGLTDPEFKRLATRFPYNDASIVVAGHFVVPGVDEKDKANAPYASADIRTQLNYSIPAGGQAIFRVEDCSTTPSTASELLVINDTETVQEGLASDPYANFVYIDPLLPDAAAASTKFRSSAKAKAKRAMHRGHKAHKVRAHKGKHRLIFDDKDAIVQQAGDWSYAVNAVFNNATAKGPDAATNIATAVADGYRPLNTRTGFVVGVNGMIDVFHNRTLHHVGGAADRVGDIVANDYFDPSGDVDVLSTIAKHNPSALVFDGLDKALTNRVDGAGAVNFAAAVNAAVRLQGNGSISLTNSASEDFGYIEKFWQTAIASFDAQAAIDAANLARDAAKGVLDAVAAVTGTADTDFTEAANGALPDPETASQGEIDAADAVAQRVANLVADESVVKDPADITADEATAIVADAQTVVDGYIFAAALISATNASQYVAAAAVAAADGEVNPDADAASVLAAAQYAADQISTDANATPAASDAAQAVVNAISDAIDAGDATDAAGAAKAAEEAAADEANQDIAPVVEDPLANKDLDFMAHLVVDSVLYEKGRLADSAGTMDVTITTAGEEGAKDTTETVPSDILKASPSGHNVLEVQGHVTVTGTGTISIDAAPAPSSYFVNDGATTYPRYATPSVYLNDVLEISSGATFVCNDAARAITGTPVDTFPAIKGGEKLFFNDLLTGVEAGTLGSDFRYRFPELRLTGGNLRLNESVCIAGARLVATDRNGGDADAKSAVQFVERTSDCGDGRTLQLGSYYNTMADGSTNWATEGAYANVFKQNNDSKTVKLSLTNHTPTPRGSTHLVLASIMTPGQSAANIQVGWDTPQADNSGTAFPYGNTLYGNTLLGEQLSTTAAVAAVGTFGQTGYAPATAGTFKLGQLGAAAVPAAVLSVDRGSVCFGAFGTPDANNNVQGFKGFVKGATDSGVVFVSHGGQLAAGSVKDNNHQVTAAGQLILDTAVAQRVWNNYGNIEEKPSDGVTQTTQLGGLLNIPHDQSIFTEKGSIQIFGLADALVNSADKAGYVRLAYFNDQNPLNDQSGANEIALDWGTLGNAIAQGEAVKARDAADASKKTRNPIAALNAKLAHATRSAKSMRASDRATRSVVPVTKAMAKPELLAYIGTGDDIRQFRVSGATVNNPFQIEVSGDDTTRGSGRIREFATGESAESGTGTVGRLGEGAHAQIFGIQGGRFGLGTTNWNEHSVNPWNILGSGFVQVCPEGDCVVDVNSDLIVADANALVAVESFGEPNKQRVTFTSVAEHEIRVPAGMTLDLSSFGHSKNQQEIAFGGNVSLVLEKGATIRGPQSVTGGVVLYFTENAKLIVESPSDRAAGNNRYGDHANNERAKIVGNLQIWLNKSAEFTVGDGVLVGVQADAATPNTDVTISLNRESQFNIGSATTAGGAFEVGNPTHVANTNINFNLTTRHAGSLVHIDRQGFLGLGAGVTEKDNGNPMNGAATTANNPVLDANGMVEIDGNGNPSFTAHAETAWIVQRLHNVGKITLNFQAGTFEHNHIADGSDLNAALIAVGPATNYSVSVGLPSLMNIKGGGNIMLVPAPVAPATSASFPVNVWDYAGPLSNGTQYGLFASGAMISEAGNAQTAANAAAFFNILAMRDYATSQTKLVNFSSTGGTMHAGFTVGDANDVKYGVGKLMIGRPAVVSLASGNVSDALEAGVVGVTSESVTGPNAFAAR